MLLHQSAPPPLQYEYRLLRLPLWLRLLGLSMRKMK